MAVNFKILHRRRRQLLHLELRGEFDGSSAYELANFLQARRRANDAMIIHTDGLESLHPFGVDLFKRRFRHSRCDGIIWTGAHAASLSATDECLV
jgi:anti-anti-sigma regulatory factor